MRASALSRGAVVRSGAVAALSRAAAVLTSLLLAALVLLLVPAGPAAAEELVVTITAEGVQPQVLVARPGDTVRFESEDRSFGYRAQSTGGPWSFDSGPTALLEDDFEVPEPLTRPGTYAFRVAQDPPYRGTVLLGVATPSAAPSSAEVPAVTAPAVTPPAVSPPAVTPPAVTGALPAPPSGRELGLPAALAAVLVLSAGSLLLRVLLAVPAGPPGAVLSEGPGRV